MNFKFIEFPKIVFAYGLTAIIFLVFGIFSEGNYDIAIDDTYIVIAKFQINILIAVLFGFFTIVSWTINAIYRRLSPILNWIHFGITASGIVFIKLMMYDLAAHSNSFKDYSVFEEFNEYESEISINIWISIIFILLIVIQLLFISNVIRSFLIKRK